MGAIRNAIAKKVISKAAPEDVKAAGRIKKIEIMTQEMGLPEYLAHQVADGEITLAQAKNMEVDQAIIRNNSEPPIAPGEFDTFEDKVAQIKARGQELKRKKEFEEDKKFFADEVAGEREAELIENLGRGYAPQYTPSVDDIERSQYQLWLKREREQEIIDNNSPDIDWKGKAAGAAAAASMFPSDDAEAGAALRLSKGLTPDLAANQIRNRLNKSQGRSGGKVVTDYVHNNTNYDRGFLSSLRSEPRGSEGYTSEVKKLAFDLLQSTDDPKVKQAVMEWVQPRMARGMGVSAVTAASGANAANAQPQEQGIIANILDKMEQFELIPDEQTRTVGLELLKRELVKAIEYSEMSAKGLWGMGRGMFGLATDEAGGDTMRAMNEVWTSPNQENLNRFGRYVEDETGSRKAGATASAIGMFADPTLAF
jgi:hypothetical protein